MSENYIAAIEIGSSKITGAVGVYDPDKTLRVLAVHQEKSNDSVRYGIIHNPDEVATRVMHIIEKLEASPAVAPRRIKGVFVGLSGRSMRSVASEVSLTYPDVIDITGEILHNLKEDASSIDLEPNQDILAVVPRAYQIDGMETSSPKGAMGKSISASYDVIVGRAELKRNIQRAVAERTGLAIRGMMITPLAAADMGLSDEEKGLGCMLVDFGAETTSVSIYRKGSLCYFATLPFGGRNITRDLTTLSLLEEKAEEIKCESGRAISRETPSTLTLNGNIKLSDISNLVVARAEEIVANVIQQISYAGLKEKDLPAGIVCIGGGSNLHGLLELLENQSGLNARMGHLPSFVQDSEQRRSRQESIQTVGILYAGALAGKESCLELPAKEEPEITEEPAEEPVREPEKGNNALGKMLRSITKGFTNIFNSGVDDDSELD